MPILTKDDLGGAVWGKLRKHILQRIDDLKDHIVSDKDHDETQLIRGRVRELERLLEDVGSDNQRG